MINFYIILCLTKLKHPSCIEMNEESMKDDMREWLFSQSREAWVRFVGFKSKPAD